MVAALVATVACVPVTAQASACAGVAVVVDFSALGGTVRTGCATGDPSSGTAALTAAGFGYTFAVRQPGFVCRIDGQPAGDPCVTTPPPTASWAYWHAQPGGSWVYSDTSASAYDPAPGSVEGWSFGAGQQPGIAPPAPAPQPVQPAPRQPAPPAGQPAQPAPQPGQPTRPAGTTAPTTTVETTTAPVSSEVVATTASSSSAAPVGSTSVAVVPTASTSSGGGTFGLVVGIVVIAALAGLGVWTARRRAKAAE